MVDQNIYKIEHGFIFSMIYILSHIEYCNFESICYEFNGVLALHYTLDMSTALTVPYIVNYFCAFLTNFTLVSS